MRWSLLLAEGAGRLSAAGVLSATADARELAEAAAEHTQLPIEADTETVERFRELVSRRCRREPLQHITGRMYFRFLELISRPGCFIVRPETEMVAGDAIDATREFLAVRGSARVVDLCTGSGAIALAVATEAVGADVIGVDCDPQALALARENNARYGNVVQFVAGDARTADVGPADVVVANPPYVPPDVVLSPEVEADPPLALWGGGPRGLDMPLALVTRAMELLQPGGILVMEHAENQASALRGAARGAGFAQVHTGSDLTNRPRWLWARKED